MSSEQPDQSPEQLVSALKSILRAEDNAMGCEECFDLLDRCAELIEAGESLEAYPDVLRHLEDCICCSQEFQALLTALRAAPTQEPPSS